MGCKRRRRTQGPRRRRERGVRKHRNNGWGRCRCGPRRKPSRTPPCRPHWGLPRPRPSPPLCAWAFSARGVPCGAPKTSREPPAFVGISCLPEKAFLFLLSYLTYPGRGKGFNCLSCADKQAAAKVAVAIGIVATAESARLCRGASIG